LGLIAFYCTSKGNKVMSSDNLPIAYRYSVGDISEMARAVAQSRMFGMDQAQAMTLMLLAQAKGIHPIQAVERYHVIQGRPAMKADAMMADFQAAGGTVNWTERSDKAWEGVFTHPTHAPSGLPVRFTIEDAKRAGLLGNPTWNKYPGNMLRARVISNAIRTILPGIVAGIYTPEEAADLEHASNGISLPAHGTTIPTDPEEPREDEILPPRRRSIDARSLLELIQDGVDKVNREFFGDQISPDSEAIINVFEVQRHLLKAAILGGYIPDPGRISQSRCHTLLADFYRDSEGRKWIRRNLVSYLTSRLEEARDAVWARQEASAREEVEAIQKETSAESETVNTREREPGDDG
jgi:hypothetical protein